MHTDLMAWFMANPVIGVLAVILLSSLPMLVIRLYGSSQVEGGTTLTGTMPVELPDSLEGPWKGGTTTLEGMSNGVEWKLSSTLRLHRRSKLSQHVMDSRTAWHSGAPALPSGSYVLMMSLTEAYEGGKEPGEGFLGAIVRKAADMALDVYVGGYFGDAYKTLVNMDGSESVVIEGIAEYFIRSNVPDLARKCLTGAAARHLRSWKETDKGFGSEEAVKQAGILLCDSGCFITCQASMGSEEEARRFADFCSAFVAAVKSSL